MTSPGDEEKTFFARWNALTRIMLIETSVKVVARSVGDFADYGDGSSCHPSSDRIARETGYSDKTVRTALATLRGLGMAQRVKNGVSYQRLADEYQLVIPDDWLGLPLLGPHGQRFNCVHCGKAFNPSGNSTAHSDGRVTFDLRPMTFCSVPPPPPAPRAPGAAAKAKPQSKTKTKKPPSCLMLWSQERQDGGGQPYWGEGVDRWKLFYEARHDDW